MYYSSIDFYKKLFESKEPEFSLHATTKDELDAWRRALKARLSDILGLNHCIPCEGRHEKQGMQQVGEFLAEHHTLETEPGIVMPFLLLMPSRKEGRHPVLIIPHGHGGGKEKVLVDQADFIRDALEDGFCVVCPDERGSGERREYLQQGDEPEKMRLNSHRELAQLAINFGRSFAGNAVWDLMRLADWIKAQSFAGEFLACVGMSGGGQQTLFFTALDERVNAGITSGYFYGVEESFIELPGNCACNFIPHLFETADIGDIGAMIAPRYFFIESGEKDHLSGKSGIGNVLPQVETARQAYHILGVEEHLVHSIHPGPHEWVGSGMRTFLQEAMCN